MNYFYDRALKQFVDASGSSRTLRSLRFMRDEDREMSINIQDNGTAWTANGTASVTFGIKQAPGETSDILAIIEPAGFTAASDIYTGTLELNGDALSDLLGTDFSLKLFCQLVITDDDGTHKSDVIPVIMGNDIIRGNEGTPSVLPDPDAYVRARAVVYDAAQTLTDPQKAQARTNIGVEALNQSTIEAAITNDAAFLTSIGAAPTTHTHEVGDITPISSGKLVGRHGGGSGAAQEVGLDGGLEFHGANIRREALTGDVTAAAGDNATTIATNAVTNAKLAHMATATIKGRTTAGTGDPEDLTAAQARTVLGLGTAATANTADLLQKANNLSDLASTLTARQNLVADLGPILLVGDGQSNMVSATTAIATILSNRVFAWNGSAWLTQGATSVPGAMVIRMAEKLAAETGRNVYCVISGLSGTAIAQWMGSGTSSTRYVATKALVEGALASSALTTAGKTEIDGFVWMQGEADLSSLTYVANFQTLMSQFAAETWFDETKVKVLIPRVTGWHEDLNIWGQQTDIPNYSPWWTVVPTVGIPTSDNVHFALAGHTEIGLRLAGAYNSTPQIDTRRVDIRTTAKNIHIGRAGLDSTGVENFYAGFDAGDNNAASYTVGIGTNALRLNSQDYAVGIGHGAAESNTGTRPVMIGFNAGNVNTGNQVVLIGERAGRTNAGARNVAVGYFAGETATGGNTVCIGGFSGLVASTGCVYIGDQTGRVATGAANSLVGFEAGRTLTTGTNNVALGHEALENVTTQTGNVAIGKSALNTNTGGYAISLGFGAGLFNNSEDVIYIGRSAGPQTSGAATTNDFDNTVSIGTNAQALKANQFMAGGPTTTSFRTPATQITTGTIANYANDAAADADATLPSGSFYRTTAGGRALFQKP